MSNIKTVGKDSANLDNKRAKIKRIDVSEIDSFKLKCNSQEESLEKQVKDLQKALEEIKCQLELNNIN